MKGAIMKKIKNLFYLFFPLLLGTLIGILVNTKGEYSSLIKPPLSPPSILFPIIWTIIYLLMGISFYLYKKNDNRQDINITYYIQLAINISWSIIFFTFKLRLLASIWIILLDYFVIKLIRLFNIKNKISAKLNYLYLAWILFATYLTIGIYLLN